MSSEDKGPLSCVDSILEVEKGKRIRAERKVNPEEKYFLDHFKGCPILPGVLMVEGLVQTSSWHIRILEDFKHSQIRMIACSSAKFSQLVKPGAVIEYDSELLKNDNHRYDFKGKVIENGKTVSSAKFSLLSQPINEIEPLYGHLESALNQKYKESYKVLSKKVANKF